MYRAKSTRHSPEFAFHGTEPGTMWLVKNMYRSLWTFLFISIFNVRNQLITIVDILHVDYHCFVFLQREKMITGKQILENVSTWFIPHKFQQYVK